MTVFQRYLILQAPGWVLAAIILAALHLWASLPLWIAVGLFAFYAGKDFVLYPFLRRAYESDTRTGAEQLIGATGTATEDLAPEGYIRVRGELWRATLARGSPPVHRGARVRVQSAVGLTLVVTRDDS